MLSQPCMTAEPAEAAVHDPPSTGQDGIADLDLDLIERQAQHLGADLCKNSVGAGADIRRRCADRNSSFWRELDFGAGGHA